MAVRKRKSADTPHIIIILILAYLVLNVFMVYFYYCDYQQKINIAAVIAAESGQSGIDVVAEILKSNNEDAIDEGRHILYSYGYLQDGKNIFYKQFMREVIVTAFAFFFLFVILFFFLLVWRKSVIKRKSKDLSAIEEAIERFRNNDFQLRFNDENDEDQEKISYQLDALGNYVKLLKEEALHEKEGTKELVSDISHQLKTPVAALDTCFSVLVSGELSEKEQKEFQVRCRNALDGLESLLQSLLEISRLEAGLIQIDKKRQPIMGTIIEAVNRIYPKASEKNIEISFDYDEKMEDYDILHDKRWACEAIINVLDNAVKYSETNSEIIIRVQKRNDFVRIEIEDNGIGIPKEEYHKIFQRFFRGSLPKVKEESGSGIGLFLTREIVEKHQGTITVNSYLKSENEVGKNVTIFVIQLPD